MEKGKFQVWGELDPITETDPDSDSINDGWHEPDWDLEMYLETYNGKFKLVPICVNGHRIPVIRCVK